MPAVLRVLILEDSEADVDLIRNELDQAAMRAQLRRVDYIQKPFTPDAIAQKMRDVLDAPPAPDGGTYSARAI
jgi:DNA-binding NtrC family response regulator